MTNADSSTHAPANATPPTAPWQRLAGLLLFLPAVLCCLGTLAGPTVSTLRLSLRETSLFDAGDFVGLENYAAILGDEATYSALGFTLAIAFVRAALIVVVPLLLALGLQGLGAAPRALVRLAGTVPMALYIPALIGLAWLAASHPAQGLLPQPGAGSWVASPGRARLLLLSVDAVYVLAVSVALGVAAYLAALRDTQDGRPAWPALAVVGGLSALAALASGLQALTLPLAMTRGGPANATATLALLQYNHGLVRLNFGPAAALGVLVLAGLMLLGLLAALLVLGTRLRLALAPRATPGPRGFIPLAALGLLIALPALLAAVIVPAWLGAQGLGAEFPQGGRGALNAGRVLLNTLLPPLPVVALQVLVAWAGALGLSALRPLGRASEWLLLLFAPWLFVTLGPVSLAHFSAVREAGAVNTALGLLPPLRLSVPMLFVLALFFRGQAARWQAAANPPGDGFMRHLVVPSLPHACLLLVLGWFAGVQELLWPTLAAQSAEWFTASVAAVVQSGAFGADPSAIGGLLLRLGLPLFVLFALLLGVIQLTVLDRLALSTGDDLPETA